MDFRRFCVDKATQFNSNDVVIDNFSRFAKVTVSAQNKKYDHMDFSKRTPPSTALLLKKFQKNPRFEIPLPGQYIEYLYVICKNENDEIHPLDFDPRIHTIDIERYETELQKDIEELFGLF